MTEVNSNNTTKKVKKFKNVNLKANKTKMTEVNSNNTKKKVKKFNPKTNKVSKRTPQNSQNW